MDVAQYTGEQELMVSWRIARIAEFFVLPMQDLMSQQPWKKEATRHGSH